MSRDREALIDIVEAIKLILRYVEAVDLDEIWTVISENLPQLLTYIKPLTLPES